MRELSNPQLIRLREVIDRTGLSKTAIYELMGENQFPKQVRLTRRSVGWIAADVDNWIRSRVNESMRWRQGTLDLVFPQNSGMRLPDQQSPGGVGVAR